MSRSQVTSLVLGVAILTIAFTNVLLRMGPPLALIVGGAGIIGFLLWLATTWRRPAEPERILPLYLATVAALQVHICEEYLSGFPERMSAAFHLEHFSQRTFLVAFALIGPAIWVSAAIGLLRRVRIAHFIAWFLFVGPGFLEFTHFLFPIFEGGPYHYFPGMYTAPLPMIPGTLAMIRLVRDAPRKGRPTSGADGRP